MSVADGSRSYRVAFPHGSGVNAGSRVSVNPSYPGIEADYRHTLQYLAVLTPDIWLHSHTETMGFDAKRARVAAEAARAWVDRDGYKRWVACQVRRAGVRRAFRRADGPSSLQARGRPGLNG